MPEEIRKGAPCHPYDNPKEAERLDPNKVFAKKFWWRLRNPAAETSSASPLIPPRAQVNLNAETVVNLFDRYRSELIKQQETLGSKLPGGGGERLDEFTLYDVYLWGFWDTHRSSLYGIPPAERPTSDVARTAKKEQALSLVEDAMSLAGHRPEKDFPKLA